MSVLMCLNVYVWCMCMYMFVQHMCVVYVYAYMCELHVYCVMCVSVPVCVWMYMHTCVFTYMCVYYIYVCVVCNCMYVIYMCMDVYDVCVYVWCLCVCKFPRQLYNFSKTTFYLFFISRFSYIIITASFCQILSVILNSSINLFAFVSKLYTWNIVILWLLAG